MADFSAGDAKLAIVPDATGFKKKLEADMGRIRAEFGLNVTAQTAQARADIDRLRVQQERNSISLGVDANLAKLQAELAAFRAKQTMSPVKLPVSVDKASQARVEADARELAGKFASSFKSALAINMVSAGFGLIPGAVTLAAELTQALQQLSQAALLVPGALSAAGASVGTLITGLSGVGDAYSALSKEAEAAGANQQKAAEQATAAAQRSQTAAQSLVRAQRELGNAYRDTRRDLENLNLSLRGGQISEQQAILNAQKARRDLAADLAKGQVKDQLDYQSRLLDIAQADQSVAEAHQRNIELQEKAGEANQKGIANADRVVAANEAVASAQNAVNDANDKAKQISEQASAASTAAAAAMAKLAPNAQEFVRAMQDLKPAFLDLRGTVQQNLFAGLSQSLRTLVASDMPMLKEGLGDIATAWNGTLKALMGAYSSDSTKSLLSQLFGNTAEAQTIMNKAIDPLVNAFGVLSVAGSKTLPHLADVFDRLATRFDDFIGAAAEDGRLDKWIAEGERGFANLGNILLNLGKTFNSIHEALGGPGMLATLENLTERMADFFGSAKGQGELREFFAEGRAALDAWKPILKDLPGLFKGLFDGAAASAGVFMPILREITHFLSTNPGLVKTLVTAFLTFKTVSPVIDGVKMTMGLLSTAITNVSTGFAPLKTKAKDAMDAVDGEFAKVGKEGSGMSRFSGALSALSGAGGAGLALLVTVGLPLVQNFATKFTQDMDDAKDATGRLDDEARNLIGSLQEISNLVGANARGQVVDNLSNLNPGGDPSGGLSGDAIKAADTLLGSGGGQIVTDAALPGGDQKYGDVMGKLRDAARGRVNDYIKGQGIDMDAAKKRGIDETTILDAYLGVPDALEKIREWKDLGVNVIRLDQIAPSDQNDPAYQAGLIGGGLNLQRQALPEAQARANRNQAAQYGQRTLNPEFAGQFPGAEVRTGASGTAIITTAPPSVTGMEADGPPSSDGKYTYMLPAGDVDKYTTAAIPNLGGYASGGQVSGPGSGTSDSIPAWLSNGEFVVNAKSTQKHLPLLEAINSPHQLPAQYADGGLVDPNGNPTSPGMMPGPSTISPVGNAPMAPAPASVGGGLLGAFLGGMGGTLGSFVNMGLGAAGATLPGMDPAAGTLSQQAGVTGQTVAGTPEGDFATRMAGIPGLWGLVGGMMSPDPVGASVQWAGQTLDWVASSGMNILGKVGSTLWSGALSAVGLENSILSPNNVYNQALQSVGSFALGGTGPIGALLGMAGGAGGGVSGGVPGPAGLGSQTITLGDGSTISIPTYGTSQGTAGLGGAVQNYLGAAGSLLGGGGLPGMAPAGSGERLVPGQWGMMDALAAKFKLNMVSGYRAPNGPTVAGVAANKSYHGIGRAHDYSNTPAGSKASPEEIAFAKYIAAKYGAQLKELIFEAPGFNANINDGRVVGPFGSFYTLDQAGYHGDHVHVAFDTGGWLPPGDTQVHNATGAPELVLNGAAQKKLANAGIAPGSLLQPGAPGPTPPGGNAQDATPGQPGGQPPADPNAAPADPNAPPAAPPPPPPPDQNGQPAPEPKPGEDMARPEEKNPLVGGAGMGAAPASRDHTLPGLNTAIMSGAQNIGSWITTAVSAAAAGGTMGAGGGAAAGALSPLIQGGIMQGAKVLTGGLNVLSSLMVGNVPGSFGAQDDSTGYGQLVRPQQRDPITAPGGARIQNNTFNGMDVPRVFQELDLRDAQHKQAALAGYRG